MLYYSYKSKARKKTMLEIKEKSNSLKTLNTKKLTTKLDGTFDSAIKAALKLAVKENVDFYVYKYNSYMRTLYGVTYRIKEANFKKDIGSKIVKITPDKNWFESEAA